MQNNASASMRTLVGIVTPCAWEESGRVAQVSLCATDDEEYVIANSDQFLGLVQKAIRAEGLVTSGNTIHRAITIKRFEMLDSVALTD